MNAFVQDKIMAPKDVHVLIPFGDSLNMLPYMGKGTLQICSFKDCNMGESIPDSKMGPM